MPDSGARWTRFRWDRSADGGNFSQNGRRWHHAPFRTPDLPEQLFFGREHVIINWLFDNCGYLNTLVLAPGEAVLPKPPIR